MKRRSEKGMRTGRISYPGISACLIYLLAGGLMMTEPTFSRFVSGGDGQDGAGAAAAVITVEKGTESEIKLACIAGTTEGAYTFTVASGSGGRVSEVAVRYDVSVELSEGLPDGVSVTLDGKEPDGSEGSEYRFRDAGVFAAGEEEEENHSLEFSISSPEKVTEQSEIDVTVTVIAEQID